MPSSKQETGRSSGGSLEIGGLSPKERDAVVRPRLYPGLLKEVLDSQGIHGTKARNDFRVRVITYETGANLARSISGIISADQTTNSLADQLWGPGVFHSLYLRAQSADFERVAFMARSTLATEKINLHPELAAEALGKEVIAAQDVLINVGHSPEKILQRTQKAL